VDEVEVTEIRIAINRDEVQTLTWPRAIGPAIQGWVNRFGIPSRTNQLTPLFAASLHGLQVLSAVKAVCADDWVVRPYRTAGKWGEPIKVPSIMDLFLNPNRSCGICSMTIFRAAQHVINADHSSAAGTIGSRACWLLDAISFGEMP